MTEDELDALLDEAQTQPFSGWDFSWLDGRMTVTSPPWDYQAIVERYARSSPDLLDMGTGGGEWLAGIGFRPPRTVATEGWPPNVPVARDRLMPLGIDVHDYRGGPDNVDQPIRTQVPAQGTAGSLPFSDSSFHLISNRHESYVAAEVRRILTADGHFVTQQVGVGFTDDFRRALDLPVSEDRHPGWNLGFATRQLEAAGLQVVASGAGFETQTYADAAGFAWYLRAVPWTVEGFLILTYREQLHRLQKRIDDGHPLTMRLPLFWLATTPAKEERITTATGFPAVRERDHQDAG